MKDTNQDLALSWVDLPVLIGLIAFYAILYELFPDNPQVAYGSVTLAYVVGKVVSHLCTRRLRNKSAT
jgi:hypothetical protein